MRKLVYIERLVIAVLLLLLLVVAPAMAQTIVYPGQTTPLEVVQNGTDTYTWELYDNPSVNFATDPGVSTSASYAEFVGGSSGPAVKVLWKLPGTYFFRINAVDPAGCSRNLKVGMIKVMAALPTAVITDPDVAGVCAGKEVSLVVTFTGTGPWDFTYTDGITEWQVGGVTENSYNLILDTNPVITTVYWINKITDNYGTNTGISNKVTQTINPLPAPSKIYHR